MRFTRKLSISLIILTPVFLYRIFQLHLLLFEDKTDDKWLNHDWQTDRIELALSSDDISERSIKKWIEEAQREGVTRDQTELNCNPDNLNKSQRKSKCQRGATSAVTFYSHFGLLDSYGPL